LSEYTEKSVGTRIFFAEEKLQKEVQAIGAKGIEIVFDIKKGDAAKTILAEQEDKKIDLIVMAAHGRKGFLHRLGSVTDKVMTNAKCPVLLAK